MYPNCLLNEDCKDCFKLLLKVKPHFPAVRTILRQLYNIRQLNNWLFETEKACMTHNYSKFCQNLKTTRLPSKIPAKLLNEREKRLANLDNLVEDKFGHLAQQFTKACFDFPSKVCNVCRLWCKKTKNFNNWETIPGVDYELSTKCIEDLKRTSNLPI